MFTSSNAKDVCTVDHYSVNRTYYKDMICSAEETYGLTYAMSTSFRNDKLLLIMIACTTYVMFQIGCFLKDFIKSLCDGQAEQAESEDWDDDVAWRQMAEIGINLHTGETLSGYESSEDEEPEKDNPIEE